MNFLILNEMTEINLKNLKDFFRSLQENGAGVKEMKQKLNSVDNFVDWANRKGLFNAIEYKQLHEGIADIKRKIGSIFYRIAPKTLLSRLKMEVGKRVWKREKTMGVKVRRLEGGKVQQAGGRPWFAKAPQDFDIRHYIGISIILVIMAALGAGAYNQFFKEAETPFAFPTNLTAGGRTLSFQGRLTDSLGNPISTATNLKFKLYNASTAGTTLYDTSTCSITPDQNGIFDVLIGGSSYSPTPPQEVCGTEITQNIFSDWPNVYLGITIGSDAEATPRQQIANVGYAINAETLQGFPPGSGFSNIPYIDYQGNVIIATSAAGIRNSWASTNFTLSSTGTITVQSAGSGDVALYASESGNITATTGQGTALFNVLTGNLKVGNGSPGVSLDGEDAYIEGTLEVDGATTLDGALDVASTIQAGSSNITLTLSTGYIDADALSLYTPALDGASLTTGSPSGLEVVSDELTLLQGCADNEILKWDETEDDWNCEVDAGGNTAWDDIADPDAAAGIAMAEYAQTLDWNTGSTAATFNGLTVTMTNDASTDITTQYAFVIDNLDDGGSTGTTESLLVLDNSDTNEAVTDGLLFVSAGGGFTDFIDTPSSVFKVDGSGNITGITLDTGQGANELYDMDQNVLTTSAVTFATLDTGQGANELYDMDQNVLTTSTPQFARLGLGAVADATNILTGTSASTTDLSKTLNITHTGIITGTGYAGYFSTTGASTTNVGLYATATGATNNYAAIFEAGSVGIGTTAPTFVNSNYAGLHVNAPTSTSVKLTNATSGETATDGFEVLLNSANQAYLWNREAGSLSIGTNATEIITVLSGGNVGIGTTTPDTFKLQVAGDVGPDTAPTPRALTTVDSVTSASTGQYTSIYCVTATDCKISYYDATNTNLMMADCDDATCSTKTLTTVDSAVNGGTYTSIYCLSSTDCKIAYYDINSSSLKMADCDNATCSTKTLTQLTQLSDADLYPSIYCISSTDCKISYYDDPNTNLMMADCDDATCSTKTLTTVDSVTSASTGTYTSIYCVSSTDCKISYLDVTNTNLMMADCDDATCSTKTLTTVDSVTSVSTGVYTSIYCVTTTDCKIAYYDTTNSNLMMADCNDATCSTRTLTTVDSTTSAATGQHTSIYCISATDCKISYYDVTNTNLMMVNCESAACSATSGGYNIGSTSLYFSQVYAGDFYGKSTTISSFDIAENYKVQDESIEAGDIVTTDPSGDLVVAKSNTAYQSNMLGVISTKPGITLAEWEDENRTDMRPVALAGKVPVKIASSSASINIGDFLTSSNEPGRAMKATKAGYTIGKALQSWKPCAPVIPNDSSVIPDPDRESDVNQISNQVGDDNGGAVNDSETESVELETDSVKSGSCGTDRIEVFVSLGYYDPDIFLTSTGDLKIVKSKASVIPDLIGNPELDPRIREDDKKTATESTLLSNLENVKEKISSIQRSLQDDVFQISNSAGEIITRIGVYAEIVSGKIKAGIIGAENAIISNALVAKDVVAEKITSTIGDFTNLSVSNKFISPVVETDVLTVKQKASIKSLETETIKPKDKDLVIDLSGQSTVIPVETGIQNDNETAKTESVSYSTDSVKSSDKGELAKFIIKGINNIKAAEIDAAGNATFSGTLTSNALETNQASISGKLIAKEIESENLKALEQKTSAVEERSGKTAEVSEKLGTDINEIQKFLADIRTKPISNSDNYQDIGSIKIPPEELPINQLTGKSVFNNLSATGETSLYSVFVSNTLTAGNLLLEGNKIQSLDFELKLSALSSINLLDGQVIISKTGGLTTKGTLTAQAGIKTNKIEPLNPNENIFIKNLETNSLQISDKYLNATSSASVITAADNFQENGLYSPAIKTNAQSAGIAIIKKQDEDLVIYNDSIKKDSLVYLTPTVNTGGNNLSVVEKEACSKTSEVDKETSEVKCTPYFKVSANNQNHEDIKFNWLIIN